PRSPESSNPTEGPNVMNEQTNVGPDPATPAGRTPASARGTAFKTGAIVLAGLCLVIGAACWLHKETPEDQSQTPEEPDPAGLFFGWDRPLFAVVLSAQEHGYLQPCGCSDPQYGGLERRYNFLQSLRLPKAKGGRGWPVVAYDLGDIAQTEAPAKLANVQALIKYRYSMQALKIMGYSAVSFGESEAALPLAAAMDEYALNEDRPPVLAFNLTDKDKLFPDKSRGGPEWGGSYVGSWQVTPVTPGVHVGAVGIIGTHDKATVADLITKGVLPAGTVVPTSVGEQITKNDRHTRFEPANKAVPAGVAAMNVRNPDFRVLLYQGPVELAKLIPTVAPDFNIILCVSQEDEPPGRPEVVKTPKGETWVIRVGHKGKNLGVVGVFRPKAGGPFEMKYQLVPIAPRYKTRPPDKAGQPIIALMERYTRELKSEDYLSKYGKVPHPTQAALKLAPAAGVNDSDYVGSEACKKCHATAFKIWAKSKHATAYTTLVNAKEPSLREYDPECVVCHTVGFRYQTGYANAAKTPNLKDVGCESCHGPGGAHVKRPRNAAIHALMNPWKAPVNETPKAKEQREFKIEGMCRGCHDAENDVTWKAFAPKWKDVDHPTPPGGEKRDEAGE
ncbi:MAG TPA: cytochrome c family protein, partial [Gemmataceae bacterium]|nr:cytochrome c family protein [Gemmataceae bacterium]